MDVDVSRAIIKGFLQNKGRKSIGFDITPNYTLYWWKLLNAGVFENLLIPPRKIICGNFSEYYGWCETWSGCDEVEFGIRSQLKNNKFFLSILVHEMVHQAQWEIYEDHKKFDHGKTFMAWKPLIKDYTGLCLQVSY